MFFAAPHVAYHWAVRCFWNARSGIDAVSRRWIDREGRASIVHERSLGVSQDDVRVFIQDTNAGLYIARVIQIVVGCPLEKARAGKLEDPVEIGYRAEVFLIAVVANTGVALRI